MIPSSHPGWTRRARKWVRRNPAVAGLSVAVILALVAGSVVSAVYAVLDPTRNEITIANAGHLPMLIHHAATNKVAAYSNHGPVLGVLPSDKYGPCISEQTIHLAPRDRLILFTDGVNEAKDPAQGEFGLSHLHSRMVRDRSRPSKEMIRNIVAEVDVHRSGWEQSDDITIIAAQRVSQT